MSRLFTIGDAVLTLGSPRVYRQFARRTQVTPVLLAQAYRGHPPGTQLGTVQTQMHRGHHPSACTIHAGTGILGHDYEWLVGQFQDEECGDRQARLDRIRSGAAYQVRKTFGYTGHDPCVYEPGDVLLVIAKTVEQIRTRVLRPSRKPCEVAWNRSLFETLVAGLDLTEQQRCAKNLHAAT